MSPKSLARRFFKRSGERENKTKRTSMYESYMDFVSFDVAHEFEAPNATKHEDIRPLCAIQEEKPKENNVKAATEEMKKCSIPEFTTDSDKKNDDKRGKKRAKEYTAEEEKHGLFGKLMKRFKTRRTEKSASPGSLEGFARLEDTQHRELSQQSQLAEEHQENGQPNTFQSMTKAAFRAAAVHLFKRQDARHPAGYEDDDS